MLLEKVAEQQMELNQLRDDVSARDQALQAMNRELEEREQ